MYSLDLDPYCTKKWEINFHKQTKVILSFSLTFFFIDWSLAIQSLTVLLIPRFVLSYLFNWTLVSKLCPPKGYQNILRKIFLITSMNAISRCYFLYLREILVWQIKISNYFSFSYINFETSLYFKTVRFSDLLIITLLILILMNCNTPS